ncbi:hypothetical protein RSSM_06807 [Rhodopirellula sallentina SM41]|uniref:Uncharacterized protein n=1 Tax=Rhodopirellula sallentina SM41 TaxID=1263870 RepID=M5TRU1_9BACT|nr:hypothetical protein RSSM_06807 [Rhodopirellula sallentina SM41]
MTRLVTGAFFLESRWVFFQNALDSTVVGWAIIGRAKPIGS